MIPINNNCINLIKSFEGLVLNPYHGAADRPEIFTIGYGTIKYPSDYMQGKMVAMSDPTITPELAEQFLMIEIKRTAGAIDLLLRNDLTANQFAALISFAYNLGDQALKGSTLRGKVNTNPLDTSISAEFIKWVHSNGQVMEGLIRRRRAEAELYFKL